MIFSYLDAVVCLNIKKDGVVFHQLKTARRNEITEIEVKFRRTQ